MPEGPETHRTADALAAAVAGQVLTAVEFAPASLTPYQSRLRGRRIEAIMARGKALLTHFEGGLTLYSHNQLYGVWRIADAGQRPETSRALRVRLETARKAILLYSASDLSMWRTAEVDAHPYLQRLGPDVLDPALDAAAVAARLQQPSASRRTLAALLLDQGFLAGMGNYLRSEVLYRARLAPDRRPGDLTGIERNTLAELLLRVPRESYLTRGIAPARGMRTDYLAPAQEGFRFRVFDREGEPCETCSARIVRIEAGARRLYLCPRCQR
jgi:endonuclease-8